MVVQLIIYFYSFSDAKHNVSEEHLLFAKDGDVARDVAQPFQLVNVCESPVPWYLRSGKGINLFTGFGMLFAWACTFWA